MKPTVDYIARKFQEFNAQMFGGKLTMHQRKSIEYQRSMLLFGTSTFLANVPEITENAIA